MTFVETGLSGDCGEHAVGSPPRCLTGAAARQARYRAARQLRSIDVRAETLARLARLCAETGLATQEVLSQALDFLEDRLRAERRKTAGTPRRRPDAVPSPVTPDLFGQDVS